MKRRGSYQLLFGYVLAVIILSFPLFSQEASSTWNDDILSEKNTAFSDQMKLPNFVLTPHDAVNISNDLELASLSLSGDGSEELPFVLERWNISSSNSHGISIENTTKFFIIKDCLLTGEQSQDFNGINILDVDPKTASIENNSIKKYFRGISLSLAENSTITRNTVLSCVDNGLEIIDSDYSILINNTSTNNGNHGIFIYLSEGCNITDNLCFLNEEHAIYCSFSSYLILEDNNCSFNSNRAIFLILCTNSEIVNNSCFNNYRGIVIDNSERIFIVGNNIGNNLITGIQILNSDNSTITQNTLFNNSEYGFFSDLTSNFNKIHHNYFYENNIGEESQAFDDSRDNQWFDNMENHEGNYWSDYSGEGKYVIEGREAVDPFPLNDEDEDSIPDWYESQEGVNLSPEQDLDNDGLTNFEEYQLLTSAVDYDTDNDLIPDGEEVEYGLNPLIDSSTGDLDNDSMPNLWEYQMGLQLNYDDALGDLDEDSMPNLWEYQNNLNASRDDADEDYDGDQLSNLDEFLIGTMANNSDTDNDGMNDNWEVEMGLNPLFNDSTEDPDSDGLTNFQESVYYNTDPLDSDSDNDGFSDGDEVSFGSNPNNWFSNAITITILRILATLAVIGSLSYLVYRYLKSKRLLIEQRKYLNSLLDSINYLKEQTLLIQDQSSQISSSDDLMPLAAQLNEIHWIIKEYDLYNFSLLSREEKVKEKLVFELSEVVTKWEELLETISGSRETAMTIIYLGEVLFADISTNTSEVTLDIEYFIHLLERKSEIKQIPLIQAEIYWVRARLFLAKLQFTEANQLLTQAQKIAEKEGLKGLVQEISNKQKILLDQMDEWSELNQTEAPIEERAVDDKLKEMAIQMIKTGEIEIPKVKDEQPVMLLVLTAAGLPAFSKAFIEIEGQPDDMLVSGFISAIDSFVRDAFKVSGSIQSLKHEDYTLAFQYHETFMFCYVFDGLSYLAIQKLKDFVDKISSSQIWQPLVKMSKTGRSLSKSNKETVNSWATEIFLMTEQNQ